MQSANPDKYEQLLMKEQALLKLASQAGKSGMAERIHRAVFSNDPYYCQQLEQYFVRLINHLRPSQSYFVPSPNPRDIADGEFFLGYLPGGTTQARLSSANFGLNFLVVGTIGTGKSTFSMEKVGKSAMKAGYSAWVFTPFPLDVVGHFYEALGSGQMLYLDNSNLKLNPLCPVKNETLILLVGRIVDQLRPDNYWRDGTCEQHARTLQSAFAAFGTSAESGPYPSYYDIKEIINRQHHTLRRRAEYAESEDRGISTLLRYAGDVFDCSQGFDIATLSESSILFDLSGMDTTTRVSVVHYLSDTVSAYRRLNPGPHKQLLMIIDEADEYFVATQSRDDIHEPFLHTLGRRSRHLSVTIVLISQTIYTIPAPLQTTINNKIVFRAEDPLSKRTLSATLGLTEQQVIELGSLPNRNAIVKIPSYPFPFRMVVPEFEIPELSHAEIEEIVLKAKAAAARLPWEPRVTLASIRPSVSGAAKATSSGAVEALQLKGRVKEYFKILCEKPGLRAGQIEQLLAIPKATGKRFRDWLSSRELATFSRVSIGGRSGQALFGFPTEWGMRVARANGIEPKRLPGRGGGLHRLVTAAVKAKEELEHPGCIVDIESEEAGVRADALVTRLDEIGPNGPKRVGYEICISSLQPHVVLGLLNDMVDKVFVIVEDAKARESVKKKVAEIAVEEQSGRIQYLLVREVMKHIPPAS